MRWVFSNVNLQYTVPGSSMCFVMCVKMSLKQKTTQKADFFTSLDDPVLFESSILSILVKVGGLQSKKFAMKICKVKHQTQAP